MVLCSAGDAIIGEHHMIKWPIAKIAVIRRPDEDVAKWDERKGRSEVLLRYLRTPAVTCSRTTLVYSQSRTSGMCTIVEMWDC